MGGRTALPKTSTPCHPTVHMPNEKWSSREGTYSVLTAQSFHIVSIPPHVFTPSRSAPLHPAPRPSPLAPPAPLRPRLLPVHSMIMGSFGQITPGTVHDHEV